MCTIECDKKEESNPKLEKTKCEICKKMSYANLACATGSLKANFETTCTSGVLKEDQQIRVGDMQIQFVIQVRKNQE